MEAKCKIKINKYAGRKDSYNSLNESRFSNINKNPSVSSSIKHIPGPSF